MTVGSGQVDGSGGTFVLVLVSLLLLLGRGVGSLTMPQEMDHALCVARGTRVVERIKALKNTQTCIHNTSYINVANVRIHTL